MPKNYLKYYFLEDYLFKEVRKNFEKRGYLTPEEFLLIVTWKRGASITKVIQGVRESKRTIREITEAIYRYKSREEQLRILTQIKFIGVAITSAILTILYPNKFTVVDYRVLNSLKALGVVVLGKPAEYPGDYFKYVDICERERKKYNLSLRDFDRALWAMDFYKGKDGLKEKAAKIL